MMKQELIDLLNAKLPDNTEFIISPEDVRNLLAALINSIPDGNTVSWDGITGKPDNFPPSGHTHSQYLTSVAWGNIQDIPAMFPPSEHGHPWDSITGKPDNFPPSGHTHSQYLTSVAWGNIQDIPATFPSSEHGHPWDSITGKPDNFPPSGHTHSQYLTSVAWGNIQGIPTTFPPNLANGYAEGYKNYAETSGTINFSANDGSYHNLILPLTAPLTVTTTLAKGQSILVFIPSGSTIYSINWGSIVWEGDNVPAQTANKTIKVMLYNNGSDIIRGFGVTA